MTSKLRVKKGIAYIKTTGEPVYVDRIVEHEDLFGTLIPYALVVRGIVKQDGIQHEQEEYPVEHLETAYSQAKRTAQRTVMFEQLVESLRAKAEAKQFSLPQGIQRAMAAQAMNGQGRVMHEGLDG